MLVSGVSVARVSIGEMSPHSAAIVQFHHPWKIIQTQSTLTPGTNINHTLVLAALRRSSNQN